MAYLNHNIPCVNCFIRDEYLYDHTKGHGQYSVCDVHSVASIEHRVPMFECLLENGVNWTRRPLTAFCWKKEAPVYPIEMHHYWDCFSPYIDVNVRERLARKRAELVDHNGKKHWGEYMFTLDWGFEGKAGNLDVNFSEDPEHKCGHFFMMDDGNFFCYPNNRIIWNDVAFTYNRLKNNPGYLIDQSIYSVENRVVKETDLSYFTEFGENVGQSYDKDKTKPPKTKKK